MARTVYLHIGAPKTGTSYLQDRLALNRGALSDHGIEYPLGFHASQFKAALDLIDLSWGQEREDARGEWDALVGRARRGSGTVLVSHELLAAATPDQVGRAMRSFDGFDVHLVYSARDIARQMAAEWQEGVKHRRRLSFARFLTEVQEAPRTKSELWFWRVQGLPDVLSRWSVGLAPEQVHLVTVPPLGADRALLWRRFCAVFGIDPAWAPQESVQSNRSMGAAETTLLRKLNRRLPKEVDADAYRTLVRELLARDTLAQRADSTPITLPPGMYPWAREISEEWIEWVEGSGIQVVGDVDELRPAAPAEGDRWFNPDRPARADTVDVALDALVAMTVEAASRPDPEGQLTAKFGKAARRLRGQ